MERIKKVFVRVHIVLWTLLSLLVGFQLETNESSDWLYMTAGVVLTCLYVFYCHFFLLTQFLGRRKTAAFFLKLVFIILTGPIPFLLLHPRGLESWEQFHEFYFMTLLTGVPIFTFLSWLARVTETLVLNTIKKNQLEKQAVQVELHFLKSQINPHFLFNTLNNIHTLVYKQAATAPEAVLRLSSLMRYMIYESNAHTVPLSREITYLQDYTGLQQLRYKKAPIVSLEIAGDPGSCFVPPLLFIHFLENAYKHSPARLESEDIKVKVEILENTLIFSCCNPVSKKQETTREEPGGMGLPNIRKRLQLLYPDHHTLEINVDNDIYAVILKIHNLHLTLHEGKDHLLYH